MSEEREDDRYQEWRRFWESASGLWRGLSAWRVWLLHARRIRHAALRTTCCARRLTSSGRQRLVPPFSSAAAPAATAYRKDSTGLPPDANCHSSAPRKLSPAPTALIGVMGSGSARNTWSRVTSTAPRWPMVRAMVATLPSWTRAFAATSHSLASFGSRPVSSRISRKFGLIKSTPSATAAASAGPDVSRTILAPSRLAILVNLA